MPRAALIARRVLAGLAVVTGVVAGVPARAHDEIPGLRNVITEIAPALPDGVTVDVVVSAADQMVAENRTSTLLEVNGDAGESFLRLGPAGAFGNVRSPTFHRSASPDGDNDVPDDARPDADPVWVRLSPDPSWGWFDHRLHRVAVARPPGTAGTVRLESWAIPMRYGDVDVVVRGHREYRRPTGSLRAEVLAAPSGIRVVVLEGAVPALSVTADAGKVVTVYAADGRPFLRIGAAGAEADVNHPAWRVTAASRGDTYSPGDAEARWEPQGAGSTVTWLEERARYPKEDPGPVSAAGSTELARWSVPVDVDGRRGEITGRVRWIAAATADDGDRRTRAPVAGVAGGAAAAAVLAIVAIRRRRLWPQRRR